MKNYALQRPDKAGFTFIEVLLSLLLVSLMTTCFLEGTVVSSKWVAQANQKTTAIYAALSVLEYINSAAGQELFTRGCSGQSFNFRGEDMAGLNLPEDMEISLYWQDYEPNRDLRQISVRVKWLATGSSRHITMCTLQGK